ncbi:hypothetical protein IWW50_002763, partial [Coemansia erecta]
MYQETYEEDFAANIEMVADSYAKAGGFEEGDYEDDELQQQQAQAGVQAIPEQVRKFLGHL